MTEPSPASPIFHIGIVVPDLQAAMEQLGAALQLTWGDTRQERHGDWDLLAVTSVEGPPHVELQQGSPGSPWDAQGAARFDHVQVWAPDWKKRVEELADSGVTVDVDGDTVGQPFCYFRTADGLRVEVINENMKSQFYALSALDTPDA